LRSIRLLPVVIFAALALLLFKGIGLVTNGGYVLTGPAIVLAAEGGEAETAGAAAPSETVLTDNSPVMGDTAPTLPAKVDAPPEVASSSEHADTSASSSSAASSTSSSEAPTATVCPDAGISSVPPTEGGSHDLNDKIGSALAKGCPSLQMPVNEHGDVLPSTKDGNGKIVPLTIAEGEDSQAALLQRLGERRAELDKREADLEMRTALVEAAQKKLDDRTRELQELEAKVAALVDEKQAAEDAGFRGIVSMYEQMKPKDAAKIFDTLNINVLLKIARAMNPRKVSPILGAMSAAPAQALTTALATTTAPTAPAVAAIQTGENLAALPQIVGH
jgi:flagellar motility protein MotE (MotC chaperone)